MTRCQITDSERHNNDEAIEISAIVRKQSRIRINWLHSYVIRSPFRRVKKTMNCDFAENVYKTINELFKTNIHIIQFKQNLAFSIKVVKFSFTRHNLWKYYLSCDVPNRWSWSVPNNITHLFLRILTTTFINVYFPTGRPPPIYWN